MVRNCPSHFLGKLWPSRFPLPCVCIYMRKGFRVSSGPFVARERHKAAHVMLWMLCLSTTYASCLLLADVADLREDPFMSGIILDPFIVNNLQGR